MKRNEEINASLLPRYAPELNDVEHVNRALKRHVCSNRFYEDLEDLRRTVRRYLRQYSINKSKRKRDLT